jgi:hypothetical protein
MFRGSLDTIVRLLILRTLVSTVSRRKGRHLETLRRHSEVCFSCLIVLVLTSIYPLHTCIRQYTNLKYFVSAVVMLAYESSYDDGTRYFWKNRR